VYSLPICPQLTKLLLESYESRLVRDAQFL
jgi:hypothetical protein